MLFWIFMLVMELLIPFTMIGFGKRFLKNAPKEINDLFGYRTSMSMKNKDTWLFAHCYIGKLWYWCGFLTLFASVVVMIFMIGKPAGAIGTAGGILTGIQLIPLAGSIIPTEIALKRAFDADGKRKDKKS